MFRNKLMFDNILYIKLIAYLDLKSTIYIMSFINTQGHLVSALLHFQERILSRVHIHSLWVLIILWDKLYTSEEEIVNLLNHFKSCLRKTYQVKWNKFEIQCFQNIYYSRRLFNGNFYDNCFHPIVKEISIILCYWDPYP